jgi:hypothetical protein
MMTLPSFLLDFPKATTPEYKVRAQLLGKQWPVHWKVGNSVFRPISTFATLGYAFTAYSLAKTPDLFGQGKDWRLFAVNAILHVSVILHSAINMQPLNDKLAALAGTATDGTGSGKVQSKDEGRAVEIGTKWMRFNYYRLIVPSITGGIALFQMLF